MLALVEGKYYNEEIEELCPNGGYIIVAFDPIYQEMVGVRCTNGKHCNECMDLLSECAPSKGLCE